MKCSLSGGLCVASDSCLTVSPTILFNCDGGNVCCSLKRRGYGRQISYDGKLSHGGYSLFKKWILKQMVDKVRCASSHSRKFNKFGLFLSIPVNSNRVLQWWSVRKYIWKKIYNNQYIWLKIILHNLFYIGVSQPTLESESGRGWDRENMHVSGWVMNNNFSPIA